MVYRFEALQINQPQVSLIRHGSQGSCGESCHNGIKDLYYRMIVQIIGSKNIYKALKPYGNDGQSLISKGPIQDGISFQSRNYDSLTYEARQQLHQT